MPKAVKNEELGCEGHVKAWIFRGQVHTQDEAGRSVS